MRSPWIEFRRAITLTTLLNARCALTAITQRLRLTQPSFDLVALRDAVMLKAVGGNARENALGHLSCRPVLHHPALTIK